MNFAGNTDSGDSSNFKKNKQNGQIAFVVGAGILIFTLMADSIPLIIIPFGAIGWGVTVYFKGVEQERLWEENKNKTKSNNK